MLREKERVRAALNMKSYPKCVTCTFVFTYILYLLCASRDQHGAWIRVKIL